ncbi:DNA adenine methylase [Candidatus Woesearchaeota archaeon]|nr:DNA adenine methylase [Candidatus Woesearchaeota archaeon]
MVDGVTTFIKWAGGKKQLLSQFERFFPRRMERYFEPFVGGGAVASYIIQRNNLKEIYISDVNEELINAYNMVKNNVEELIKILREYKQNHSKSFYYKVREQDPSKLPNIYRAGRFIYLNKTCFNGLYRVNSQGRFNVPMGSYKNPSILQEDELRKCSLLLKKVSILCIPFEKILDFAKKGDFIYFDPPYYPLNRTSSFTTYTKDVFLEDEQKRLADVFKELDKRGCKVMLSNSDIEFIKSLYGGYNIHLVRANRMINCNASKRGAINEVVITNYSPFEKQKRLVEIP